MIDTETLSRLSSTPVGTIRAWQHRGFCRCSVPGKWDLATSLALVLFARALRSNLDTGAACDLTLERTELLREMIAGMMAGQSANASLVLFIDATLSNGEEWHRLVVSRADAEKVISAALRRGLVRLEVDNFTSSYVGVLQAFDAVRERAKELA